MREWLSGQKRLTVNQYPWRENSYLEDIDLEECYYCYYTEGPKIFYLNKAHVINYCLTSEYPTSGEWLKKFVGKPIVKKAYRLTPPKNMTGYLEWLENENNKDKNDRDYQPQWLIDLHKEQALKDEKNEKLETQLKKEIEEFEAQRRSELGRQFHVS